MSCRRAGDVLFVSGVLLAVAFVGVAGAETPCDRVIAVGDLHGAYEPFLAILRKTGLIDEQERWQGGSSCLVQLGDVVDRGARSRDLLELLMRLEQQGGDRVHLLLGNHEVMNLVGDLRYVDPGDYAAFIDDETEEERRQGYETFLATPRAKELPENQRPLVFEAIYPPGWFARRRAFSPDGRLGRWLMEKPVVATIGDTIFTHGGISAHVAREGIDQLNGDVARDLKGFHSLRRELIDSGVFGPLSSFEAELGWAGLWLEQHSVEPGAPAAQAVSSFVLVVQSPLFRADGPLWYRGLALEDEPSCSAELDEVLKITGAARIVVAHTPTADHAIRTRAGNRLFLIDTGAGPAYGGRISALEISDRGRVRAIYLDGSELLADPPPSEEQAPPEPPADPPMSDEEIEAYLMQARVVDSKPIGSGVTRPQKLKLELNGRTMSAAFKTVDVDTIGVTRFKSSTEVNFTDRYAYERAAYLLDRRLGLHMVPVVVLRTIDGQEGAVIEWVSDAISEEQRRRDGLEPPDHPEFVRQQAVMRLFDALILNTDRHLGNQLYTPSDWKLHLIDHSRGFRMQRSLPEGFASSPIQITHDLHEALANLDRDEMQTLLDGLLSKARVRSLMQRRDAILEKVERDREEFSEASVFLDTPPVVER